VWVGARPACHRWLAGLSRNWYEVPAGASGPVPSSGHAGMSSTSSTVTSGKQASKLLGKKKLARLSVLLPIRSRAFSSSFFLGSLLSRGFLSNVGAMHRMIELRFRVRVRLRVFWMQCVLPGGVEIYSTGPNSQDPSSFPRSYPIVLTGLHSPYCD
jgi:hypothetical protein